MATDTEKTVEAVSDELPEDRFINRETSWIEFNGRVLAIAEDPEVPLLERAKFLAIFTTNLDEFFQVRVAGLKEQVAADVRSTSSDGMTPAEQLAEIRSQLEGLYERAGDLFRDEIAPGLEKEGLRFSMWEDLTPEDKAVLDEQFVERIYPVLTPLAVDPAHPFPYISDLSLNLAVLTREDEDHATKFARVKLPPLLPRFILLSDSEQIVPLEEIIAAHLPVLFPGMEIVSHHVFRVTRNADLIVEEDEADDLLEAIETELTRRRLGRVVRLEVEPTMTEDVQGMLMRELRIGPDDVYVVDGPLDMRGLWAIHGIDRPDLKWDSWHGIVQPELAPVEGEEPDLFRVLRQGDVVVQHPYDSFAASVVAFIAQAARDRRVLAIKQTLYRTSKDSPIIKALIAAASAGKQVVALVELKARFDEEANITWARRLEEAGVHVVYGVVGLKTHTKTALVVRDEGEAGIRRYAHVGTGNYNDATAKVYEDFGLLTADPDIGADLSDLFNYLTGYSGQRGYRKLLVAPHKLRKSIAKLIRRETEAEDGSIVMKMNSLVDSKMIDLLYRASQAGTPVDLYVRGVCCLRPGVPGLSENITVRSIVGRYLEHSRVYRFGSKKRGFDYYIGSADLMPRNLDHRVEAIAPVVDPTQQVRIQEALDVLAADDVLAWDLHDYTWSRVPTVEGVNTHLRMQEIAADRAHGR